MRVWDKRTAYPQVAIAAHNAEVLTCDWGKYDQVMYLYFKSLSVVQLHSGFVISLKTGIISLILSFF